MNNTKTACEIIAMITDSQTEDILYSDDVMDVPFHEYMTRFLKERKMTKAKLLDVINVERSYGYQILNGRRVPTRPMILRIALYFGMDLEETQRILNLGHKEALFPKDRFDMALIYAITHGMDTEATEALLARLGPKSLFDD